MTSCKVERIKEKHDLTDLDERLLRRRKQENLSLRDLESYINQRVLRRVMRQAGMRVLEGDPQNFLQILTGDDVQESARKQVRRELESEGVDVEEVLEDMVSYQTVRAHLNDCLNEDTSKPDAPPDPDKAEETFRGLQARAERVVERTLNRFRKHGVIQMGSPAVSVSLTVTCTDCGRTYSAFELLKRLECACQASSEDSR